MRLEIEACRKGADDSYGDFMRCFLIYFFVP